MIIQNLMNGIFEMLRRFWKMTEIKDQASFEDWLYDNFKPKTIQNTLRSLRYLDRQGVDLNQMESFRKWVRESRKKGTLDRTLNTYIKAYNRILTYRDEPKMKFFKEMHSMNRPIASMEDYEALSKASETFGYTRRRKALIIELLFKTGARLNEIASISIDAIQEDTILIVGKGQKPSKLYLLPSVRQSLDKYIKVRQSNGTAKLFTNKEGEPMTYDGIRQEIYQISKKAGISFSAHRARRFFARYLYTHGVDLEGIRLLMRHAKFDTTKDYIGMAIDDAIEGIRKKDLDFKESDKNLNPKGKTRPGRAAFYLKQTFQFPSLFLLEVQLCKPFF